MNILEHTENLRQILKKLPVYMHDRLRRTVQKLHQNGKVVKFSNLVDFVESEAMKLNDPVWGRNALSCLQKRKQRKPKVMTAATNASEGLQCWGCDGPRRIKECLKLKENNLTERRSLVRAKNLERRIPFVLTALERVIFYRMPFKIHLCCLQEETPHYVA